ncbi:MAG: DUF1481 domain-containing protein [Enterobacteriaceae bacterium]
MLLLLLAGCSKPKVAPTLQATGYIDDSGAVKIWRQDDSQYKPAEIVAIYTPYRHKGGSLSYYGYAHGVLMEVSKQQEGPDPDKIQLRFDREGEVIYMQRQQGGRNSLVSEDEIDKLRYESDNLIALTDALRIGEVKLFQGRWHDGEVMTCGGQQVKPPLEEAQLLKVRQEEQQSATPVNIAWIERPDGAQLLQVTTQDLCLEQESALK